MSQPVPRRKPASRAAKGDRELQAARERARQHQVAAARARTRAAAKAQADAVAEVATQGADLPADRYLDREESWLRFAERVLELAEDNQVPLLERVRFTAIFASALDEFFGVRVAGRMRRMATGLPVEDATGLPAEEVLANVLELARELSARHARCFTELLVPDLADQGIEILRWKELVPEEQAQLEVLFKERISPVLTPLAVDPAHPFPFISGQTLSLALTIADPRTGATMFARVKVPPLLPRFLTVAPKRFVPLEDVIAAHLGVLFVGLDILEHHTFRVTRITDLEIDEDVTEDLLKSMERELLKRRFEPAVRLEVEESIPQDVLDKLVMELDVDPRAVYRVPGPLDLSGLSLIADLDFRQLKYPRFVPSESALPLTDGGVFAVLAEQDVLVHHPYDSFTASVQRLVVSAAADPRVLAIKQTLYRTSGDSEIVDALIDAAEAGKQVVVVVEIKARGDERANIAWVHKLEEAGCHVVYGMVGLKTHCKMALVVREESDGSLRRFCHIGTAVRGLRAAYREQDRGRGHQRPVQPPDRVQPPQRLPAAAGRAGRGAIRADRAHRRADRAAARGQARADPDEVQRPDRRGDHRRAVPCVERGRAGRPVGTRDLRAASRRAWPVGADPGPQRRRQIPGALAHLRIRDRDRGLAERGLDRQRRHDAQEPGPPGRDAGPGYRSSAAGAVAAAHQPGHGSANLVVVAGR
jgi:hypothetical protein